MGGIVELVMSFRFEYPDPPSQPPDKGESFRGSCAVVNLGQRFFNAALGRRGLTLLLLCAIGGFSCIAKPVASSCANAEVSPSSKQSSTDDSQRDLTEPWLDRIAQRTQDVEILEADVRYDRIQSLQRSKQIRHGKIIYIAGPPARFAIHFHQLIENKRAEKQDVWYLFDGQWLVERHEQKKLFIKQQIVSPDDPPGKSDPLALGAGPFPVPVTFKKDRIRRRFDVTIDEGESEKDPIHLKLLPKPGHRIPFTEIHLWYERATLLPLRLRTLDDSESESVVLLRNTKVNTEVDSKSVDTSEPTERGWRIEIRPFEKSRREPAEPSDDNVPNGEEE